MKIRGTSLGGQFQDLQFLRWAVNVDVLGYARTEEILPEWIAKLIVEGGLLPRLSPKFHPERHLNREWETTRLHHRKSAVPGEQDKGLTVNHFFAALRFAQETVVEREVFSRQFRRAIEPSHESGAHS